MSSVFVCLFRLQRRACTDNQPRCHTATAECPVILVLKLCDAGAKSACKWCRQSEIYRIVEPLPFSMQLLTWLKTAA